MGDGTPVYAWARAHQVGHRLRSLLRISFADAKGHCDVSKGGGAAFEAQCTSMSSCAPMRVTREGGGCAVLAPAKIPPESLGFAPQKSGKPIDALALHVGAGVDGVLMAAVAVLWEKAFIMEHHERSGGGG